MKTASRIFAALAILLSDAMCAYVAYAYCDLEWAGKYAGASAPASTAFLFAIPFVIAIAVCIALSIIFKRRSRRNPTNK